VLFVVGAVVVALLLLEGGSRVLEPALDLVLDRRLTPRAGFAAAAELAPLFRLDTVDGEPRFVRSEHQWTPGGESFQAEKSPNTFRVFCLGGSAAMGWPHHPRTSYPALLQLKLQEVLPEHRIEVVNVAGNSYGSHRVKVVFDEIVEYEPDLVLVYSGNNEFVEDVVFEPDAVRGPGFAGWLQRSAFVRLARRSARSATARARVFEVEEFGPEALVSNRIDISFGWPSELRRSREQLRLVVDHFRFNIESIVRSCTHRAVPVVLLTAPVNLADWWPVASIHRDGMTVEEEREWQSSFRDGVLAYEQGRFARAASALQRAVAIDGWHAESWFYLGTVLRRLGRSEQAKEAFERALRHDAFPVRSLFNPEVRRIGGRRNAPVVDLVSVLERETDDGMLGLGQLVDYVHPTVVSNEIIAHEVLVTLVEEGLLPARPAVAPSQVRVPIPPGVEDELWTLRGLFGQFLVMRQYEGLDRIAERMHAAVEDWSPELGRVEKGELERLLARVDETMEVVAPYRRLLRAEKLDLVAQEFTPAQAKSVFESYVELVRTTEAHFVSEQEFRSRVPERSYNAAQPER